jgi:hypothetical protein
MTTPKDANRPQNGNPDSLKGWLHRPSPDDRARSVHNLLHRRATGATSEGVEAPAAGQVHPDDVLGRLDDVVRRMPPDEVGDPAEFKRALTKLLEFGEPALRKLLLPPAAGRRPLSADELMSLEAVVIADGSRPSFLIREGSFAADHPFLGSWKDDMTVFQPALRKLAACVGRIQPSGGGPTAYNGTGTLVDADQRLVLTNYHVVKHARDVSGVEMTGDAERLAVKGAWFIDFIAETGNFRRNLWRVKEARMPKGAGVSFDGIDAAVLRIEPVDGNQAELPAPAIVLSSLADYATGDGSPTLVTIGFPGEPDTTPVAGVTVDWGFVVKTMFNNRFGVKRVAPGRFGVSPGSVAGDHLGHILSHDATTFGGASGSLVFAWKDDMTPAFALHFAGATLTANYAVSMAKAAAALRALDVPIA